MPAMSEARTSGNDDVLPWRIELEPADVRERLRAARRSGRPRYLWPDVEPAAWRASLHEIERVTRAVLAGGSAMVETGDPRALGIAAFTSGTGPLLGAWIESGVIEAAGMVRTLLLLHLHHGRERARIRHEILGRALAALRDARIEPTVLKSAATADLHFAEPGLRPGVDIDLVVAPGQFDSAERALDRSGHRIAGRQISPRKSDWRIPGIEPWPRSLELLHSGGQYGIDLHDSLTREFFGIRRVTIAGDTAAVDVGGATIRVLAQPDRLAFHALHASEGFDNLTLIRLIEIVYMARADGGRSFDWDQLIGLLREAGGLRFAWPAFALADRLSPGTVPDHAMRALENAATPALRSVVHGLRPSDAQRLDVLTLRERFMWCHGPVEHARRFAHMLFPAPAGRSPIRLVSLYADRLRRIVRGRIEMSRPPDE
jgi:hypothetical protein